MGTDNEFSARDLDAFWAVEARNSKSVPHFPSGAFEPADTLRLGLLAANGVGDAGDDVGAGVFGGGAESIALTFRGDSSASGVALIGHTDFSAIFRAVEG